MTLGIFRHLSRTKSHRDALLRNMATQLLYYGIIQSTTPKLKETQRYVEKIISIAKKSLNDNTHLPELQSRLILSGDTSKLLKKLLKEIAPRYIKRDGGYTRLMRLEPRLGDRAPQSILELVDSPVINESSGKLQYGNIKFWLNVKNLLYDESLNQDYNELTLKNLKKLSLYREMDGFMEEIATVRKILLKNEGKNVDNEKETSQLLIIRNAIESFKSKSQEKVGYEYVKERPRYT